MEGVPKSEAAKKAETALAKAVGLNAAREKAAEAITAELQVAQDALAKLDALAELSPSQHLVETNTLKRVRHLTAQRSEAEAAIAQAEEAVEAAQRAVDVATLRDLDADLRKRDQALVAEMTATEARWADERATIGMLLAKAHSIDASLRPDRSAIYESGARGLLTAAFPPRMSAFEVAVKVLAGEQVKRQAALVESQHRAAAARNEPYKPPVDEHGAWVDDERPPKPLEWRTS